MQLVTKRNKEESSAITGLRDILYKPIIITSYDIFPSQYRPGKEAVRIIGWVDLSGDDLSEISIVTEGKILINTLKENPMLGTTYETMIIKDSKTKQYLFSNITKDQQKTLIKKFNEKRQQSIKQSLSGLFDK